MTYAHSGAAPVYAPNSGGRPWSDESGPVHEGWESDGEMVRSAYALRADDDDWSQAGTLVREVFSDADRAGLVETVAGALTGVTGAVLERAFQYWKSVDSETGAKIERKVRQGAAKQGAEGMGESGERPRQSTG
jgi:catalase